MTDHLDIAATAAGFTIDANPSHAPGPFQNRAGSLDDAVMRAAADEITGWAGYAPTPLHDLPEIAERLGVKRVVFKDESARFGLGSFKALGGAYAVAHLAKQAEAAGGSITDVHGARHAPDARRKSISMRMSARRARRPWPPSAPM